MLRTIVCAVFCTLFCLASACHASSQYPLDALRDALAVALENESKPAIYEQLRDEGEALPDSIRFYIAGFGRDYCLVAVQFPERVSDKTAFIAARQTVTTTISILNRYNHLPSLPEDVQFQAVAVPCVMESGVVYYYDGFLLNWGWYGPEPYVTIPRHVIEEKVAR